MSQTEGVLVLATNPLWDLAHHNWRSLRTANQSASTDLPELLTALWAESEESRSLELPNRLSEYLVISGLLFEAAVPVSSILPTLAGAAREEMKLLGILSLIEELSLGEAHASELEAGNTSLEQEVKQRLRSGLAVYSGLIGADSPAVKASALTILSRLEPNSEQLKWAIEELRAVEEQPEILRDALIDIQEHLGW